MRKIFISSIGTGHGKTFVASHLIRQLRAKNKVQALKPLISGFDAADETNDAALLLRALGLPVNEQYYDAIAPFRFVVPTSPDLAMALENREVSLDEMMQAIKLRTTKEDADICVIEGAGGLFSPLTKHHTNFDLLLRLGAPLLLVADTRLGSISQLLSLLVSCRMWGIQVVQLVLSQSEESHAMTPQDMLKSLCDHGVRLPVVMLPRVKEHDNLPDITGWMR